MVVMLLQILLVLQVLIIGYYHKLYTKTVGHHIPQIDRQPNSELYRQVKRECRSKHYKLPGHLLPLVLLLSFALLLIVALGVLFAQLLPLLLVWLSARPPFVLVRTFFRLHLPIVSPPSLLPTTLTQKDIYLYLP